MKTQGPTELDLHNLQKDRRQTFDIRNKAGA